MILEKIEITNCLLLVKCTKIRISRMEEFVLPTSGGKNSITDIFLNSTDSFDVEDVTVLWFLGETLGIGDINLLQNH